MKLQQKSNILIFRNNPPLVPPLKKYITFQFALWSKGDKSISTLELQWKIFVNNSFDFFGLFKETVF